jgi:N-acetylglucosamine-6-sulfatase
LAGVLLLPAPAAPVDSRPNIVILLSDDQRWDTITPTFMPNVWNNLVNAGTLFPASRSTAFTNAFVPNPLCCPSRTSILTGRYSHSTGVYANKGPFGGFAAFDDKHTMATDFHDAGYRTALIGKYLNGYPAASSTYIPPGWDRWFAVDTGAFYDYHASRNWRTLLNGRTLIHGRKRFYADAPADYVTRVLSDQAISFVKDAAGDGDPFFLYYSFTAPHNPAIPEPIDAGRFASVPLPQPPSYNVVDDPTGAGKPAFIRDLPEQDATLLHQLQLESAYGIDRAIGQLLEVLPPNTILAYLSDNGYLWGEHRWVSKVVPYNESIRIPMILTSLDGSFSLPSSISNDIVLNVDLRPTLEAAAGVPLSTSVDGLDWARDPPRSAFVLEHGGDGISYCGARELDWMYVRYSDGFEELYNESADPYELNNLATSPVAADDQAAYERLSAEALAMCRPRPPGVAVGTSP